MLKDLSEKSRRNIMSTHQSKRGNIRRGGEQGRLPVSQASRYA
jgi:hypothetical protein